MRTGGCAVQQTLTTEAASVLKHSLSLARRRGHAQITPLHVAATLLSSRFSLLKRACLKSQPPVNSSSHPLQCRALELCFNVALNRLPASPGPLLHGQPSLSNALVAALKRAQAHQRRGCIEQQQQQQQQPHWIIKVEVEQLVLSILDDPSVSRVMREAGFSSTAVKATLDQLSSSVFQAYNNTSSSTGGIYSTPSSPPPEIYTFPFPQQQQQQDVNVNNNVNAVVQVLVGPTRRNVVIVADCATATHGVFNELLGKVERGQVPDELKSAHVIKFQFSAAPLTLMRREEVEANMAELKRKVESLSGGGGGGRGIIIYTGNLKWTVVMDNTNSNCVYNPVDHLVAEIGRLLSSCNSKVWLVGTANFQTYINCQMRQPPLDLLWALQPVSLPSSALSLTLNPTTCSFHDIKMPEAQKQSQALKKEEDEVVVRCCPECTSNYAKEAAGLNQISFEIDKPDWLIPHPHHKDELRRKWNRICQSLHQNRNSAFCNEGKSLMYPWWGNNDETKPAFKSNLGGASCVPRFRRQQSCHIEFSFSNANDKKPNLDSLRLDGEDKEVKISLALSNNNNNYLEMDLRNELDENLAWQSQISLSLIHETLMGMQKSGKKQEWLVIKGNDVVGKQRLARIIALAHSAHLLCFNKTTTKGHTESLQMALGNHARVVVLVEGVDLADPHLLKFLEDGVYNEKFEGITTCCQAIFILTMNDDQCCHYNANESVIPMKLLINERSRSSSETTTPLKRRAEWDLQSKSKSTSKSKDYLSLDLNIKLAEAEDDESEHKKTTGSDSSDLTRDNMNIDHNNNPLGFLEIINNHLVLNCDSAQQQQAKDMLSSKIKQSLQQVLGEKNMAFLWVEENVTEELLHGCGAFLNTLFDKWLKDVLQTSLQQLVDHRKEGVITNVRLCLGENGDTFFMDGFMGTCLPNRI